MRDVVQRGTTKTLKDVIEQWNLDEIDNNNKYAYKLGEDESVYTIKMLKTKFQGKSCKAIILQDLSAYDKLARLDEKYQKLYVASIVHDIRTPLNGIMGMLDMLRDSPKIEDGKIYLSVATDACKLLLFLTYDITDYSQLEANKFRPSSAKVELRSTVEEAVQLFEFNFSKKRIMHFMEISSWVPKYVCIDRNRYMQILLNLLANALKFTFQGEIKISVDYDSHNDILITAVRDTGIGIKEEDFCNLFKMFGKVDNGEGQNPQGVGLGLAICKRLSESMGGYITVTSKYGFGSTFTFGIKASVGSITPRMSHCSSVQSDISSKVAPGDVNERMQTHRSTFSNYKVNPAPMLVSTVSTY